MKSTTVAWGALAASLIGIAGIQLFGPEDEKAAPVDTRDHFVITTAGKKATVACEGDVRGTGYLIDPARAALACSFDKDTLVHQYLQDRADCDDVVAAYSEAVGDIPFGVVTISGVYFDEPLSVRLDAKNGNDCDRAAWSMLAPLLPRS